MAAARVFMPEFRVSVAARLLNGESFSAVSNELKSSVLYRWRDAYRKEGAAGLNRPSGRPRGGEARPTAPKRSTATGQVSNRQLAELERRLGQMALENDFLRRAFRRVKEARSKNSAPGDGRCTEK